MSKVLFCVKICENVHDYLSSDPPESFDPQQEVVELDDGDKITLNCSVGGNPPPLYSWSSLHLQETDDNQPLFTASSSGTYTCTAYNLLGKSSKQFIIKLKSKGKRLRTHTILSLYNRLAEFFVLK